MKDSTGSPPFIKPTTAADPTLADLGLADDMNAIKPPPLHFVKDIYYPTRLDYFAARALQGLVTGRAEKDRRVAAKQAVALAKELVELLDQTSG